MTIMIIKKGKLSEEKIYTLQCKECRTLFRFNRKDASFHSDQRDGDYLKIDCPLWKKKCVTGV